MIDFLEKLDPRKLDTLFNFLDTRIFTIPSLIIFMTLMSIGGVVSFHNYLHRKQYENFLMYKKGLSLVTDADGSLRYGSKDSVTGKVSISDYAYLGMSSYISIIVLLLNVLASFPISLAYLYALSVHAKRESVDSYLETTRGVPPLIYRVYDKVSILYGILWFVISVGFIIIVLLYVVYKIANIFL